VKPRISFFYLRVYHYLLRLYPADFLTEFGPEMELVFGEAIAEAQKSGSTSVLALFLRELRDLPLSLWREQRRRRQSEKRGFVMPNDINEPSYWRPASGLETTVTILPFVLFSILMTIQAYLYAKDFTVIPFDWELSMYLVALAGLGFGWVKRFPRWSLGYLGLALVTSWWTHHIVTGDFELFGYSSDHWEWRGWFALLAVALAATLITRSLSPLVDLARSIWVDLSRLSFILYAALGWLILGVSNDSSPVALRPLQTFIAALFIVLGVFPFLHLHLPWQRGLALQGAVNLTLLSGIAIGAAVTGTADVDWPILAIWLVFLLLPGILGLFQRAGSSPGFVQ